MFLEIGIPNCRERFLKKIFSFNSFLGEREYLLIKDILYLKTLFLVTFLKSEYVECVSELDISYFLRKFFLISFWILSSK